MGISGHILGERKLRAVNRATGMEFDRAFRYHEWGMGRVRKDGECQHYHIDFRTWEVELDTGAGHWSSCSQVEEV